MLYAIIDILRRARYNRPKGDDASVLLLSGNTTVGPSWRVEEKTPPGYMRVYHILDGDVAYDDETGRRRLKPERLYIFPSAAPYRITHNPADPLTCMFLHLDMLPFLTTRLIELPVEEGGFLGGLLALLSKAIDRADPLILSALSDVFELYCRQNRVVESPALPICELLLDIDRNIGGRITVAGLSARMGYSPEHFIRLFKAAIGVTPYQYVTGRRLKQAIRLLEGDLPVSRIAEAAGYRDLKTFCRAFKNKYGVTPSHYRKIRAPLP